VFYAGLATQFELRCNPDESLLLDLSCVAEMMYLRCHDYTARLCRSYSFATHFARHCRSQHMRHCRFATMLRSRFATQCAALPLTLHVRCNVATHCAALPLKYVLRRSRLSLSHRHSGLQPEMGGHTSHGVQAVCV
jgi:hypothetical protein